MTDLDASWEQLPRATPYNRYGSEGRSTYSDAEEESATQVLGPGAVRYTQSMLEVARFELARADDKANTMFRFYGVVAALSIGLLGGQGWTPLDLGPLAQALFWIGSIALLASGVFLGTTLYPRDIRNQPRDRLLYFGHVTMFDSTMELREALAQVEADHDDRLVEQLLGVSKLVHKKYRLMRRALISLGAGAASCIVAVLGDALMASV